MVEIGPRPAFLYASEHIARDKGADVLLRLLEKRFGPLPSQVKDRVLRAGLSDLDLWTDRVLEAPTLEAVLATG